MSDLTVITIPDGNAQSMINNLSEFGETVAPGLNPNTRRAIELDVAQYKDFCQTIGCSPLSSDFELMKEVCRKYCHHLVASEYKHLTIKRKVASLRFFIGVAGAPNPWGDKIFSLFFNNLMKQKPARPKQATPLTYNLLQDMNNKMTDGALHTLRDRAMINLAFDSLFRVSNLRAVKIEHLDFGKNSVFSQWSKTDQTGEGTYSYISDETINYITKWLESSKINSGYLFRRLNRQGVVSNFPLSSQSIWNVYRKWGNRIGIPNLSCHSTRTGAAVTMVEEGVDNAAIALAGHWKSAAMPIRYAAQVSVKASGMAKIR